jgi:hypothetical protein
MLPAEIYRRIVFCALLLLISTTTPAAPKKSIGQFEHHSDIGAVHHRGSVGYDAGSHTYTISGSGENMWESTDAFQFVWTKTSGDMSLSADISFVGAGHNDHRKAVLMFRASLDPGAPYVDVALHGDGLTSLQYREEKGAPTHEIRAVLSAPKHLRIERRGQYFTVWLAGPDGNLHVASGSIRISLSENVYAGIGVCSHDNHLLEKATFSNVTLTKSEPIKDADALLHSFLETINVQNGNRTVVYSAPERFEAPNWTHDGAALLLNRNGHIERLPLHSESTAGNPVKVGELPVPIDTGFATRCNNDHLISPDGASLGISDSSQENHDSLVYVLPFAGGKPRRVTQFAPSYLHGWSPDGKTLAFVGQRNGEFDVYTIPVEGGEETRLTTAKGLDDGPEYSPDGKYIYFNSERTGHMQIWRMHADGTNQEQITFDDYNNWFPHISPDGRQMVFLSYEKEITGHPENKDVTLRLMSLPLENKTADDKSPAPKITVLAKFFGGQGTINVPSWSPDSTQLAFVSYQLAPSQIAAH